MKFKGAMATTKADLAGALYCAHGKDYGLTVKQCVQLIDDLTETIRREVSDFGNVVTLRGFANIGIKKMPARKGFDFHSRKALALPPEDRVRVDVSPTWNRRTRATSEKRAKRELQKGERND